MRNGRLKEPVVAVGVEGDTEKDVAPLQTDVALVESATMVPVPVPGLEGLVSWGRDAAPEVFSPQAETLVISMI